jgi:acetyl-CoA acyltransferase
MIWPSTVIKSLLASVPQLDPLRVDDVIVGNAVPEAEQGLQVGRIIAARAVGIHAPGVTVNRYCASGLETIAMATAKIRSGMADCIIAGGTESMTMVPQAGWKTVPAYSIASDEPDYYLNMGLTAEAVAKEYNVSREDQDQFSYDSHQKAIERHQERLFQGRHPAAQCRRSLCRRERTPPEKEALPWIPTKAPGPIPRWKPWRN